MPALIGSLMVFSVGGQLYVRRTVLPRLQIRVEDSEFSGSMLQAVMVALLAAFIGLVIFMILAFDRPFRGDLGLDPGPYRQVHDVVMQDLR